MAQVIKAYLSENTMRRGRLFNPGREAVAEAQHILADVEPESEHSYYSGEPFGGHENDGTLGGTARILAESLAVIAADGGLLDLRPALTYLGRHALGYVPGQGRNTVCSTVFLGA